MKIIKTLFAILFLSTMFLACETNSVNEEIGIEDIDNVYGEDADEDIPPTL
ncbi:hypothetical protein [Aquimarina sp. AU474]|uniref:hypothetical protein n=1 Tax=Aquimarina sp. AU474 TaxID=2108529 RepID=UPI00135BD850|nr:hypothetical protein [Aquimarina sp. AU474]